MIAVAVVATNVNAQNSFAELNVKYERMADSLHDAGQNLVRFSNQAQLGIGLMIVGPLISMASTKTSLKQVQNIYIGTGAVVATAGLITWVLSYNKTRRAGQTLLNINPDGLGIAIPIK
jgi:hypothetical protein